MRSPFRRALALVLAGSLAGCSSAPSSKPASPPDASAVHGRTVKVGLAEPREAKPVEGELIAVSAEALVVLSPAGLQSVRRDDVDRVEVALHGLNGRTMTTWVTVGALLSGLSLLVACSQVEGASCGGAAILPALLWGGIGAPSAYSLARSSRRVVERAKLDALSAYARFPQGLPEGVDPEAFAAASRDASKP